VSTLSVLSKFTLHQDPPLSCSLTVLRPPSACLPVLLISDIRLHSVARSKMPPSHPLDFKTAVLSNERIQCVIKGNAGSMSSNQDILSLDWFKVGHSFHPKTGNKRTTVPPSELCTLHRLPNEVRHMILVKAIDYPDDHCIRQGSTPARKSISNMSEAYTSLRPDLLMYIMLMLKKSCDKVEIDGCEFHRLACLFKIAVELGARPSDFILEDELDQGNLCRVLRQMWCTCKGWNLVDGTCSRTTIAALTDGTEFLTEKEGWGWFDVLHAWF
jgi:hypothetical protein